MDNCGQLEFLDNFLLKLAAFIFNPSLPLRIGAAGAAVSLAALGGVFALVRAGSGGTAAGLVVAVFLCLFVAFFSFGPGVCVWVAAAELLPAGVRAKGMSFALLGNQAVTAAVSSVFLPVASRFGYAPLFFAFALAAVCYFALASRVRSGVAATALNA